MNHDFFMNRALEIAQFAKGLTKTNPMVGAVLVNDNKIISEGYHEYFGSCHAEVNALKGINKETLSQSTLYITLEPCSHEDKKTPPCAPMLVQSGIKNVVIASVDPNPKVSGNGVKLLKDNKIDVTCGVLDKEQISLNEIFYKNMNKQMPWIHLKVAQSLDGKMCLNNGISQWITGSYSSQSVHQMRSHCDAILVGGNTFKVDSPSLNVRDIEICNHKNFTQPEKIILSRKTHNLEKKQDWVQYFQSLYLEKKLGSVFIEAGPELYSKIMEQDIVDRLSIFIAPSLIGKGKSFHAYDRADLSNLTRYQYQMEKFPDGDLLIDIRF